MTTLNQNLTEVLSDTLTPTLDKVVQSAVAEGIRKAMSVNSSDQPPLLLDVNEVARRLGVGQATVRRMINSGKLKTVRCMSAIRIRQQDLDEFIAESSNNEE